MNHYNFIDFSFPAGDLDLESRRSTAHFLLAIAKEESKLFNIDPSTLTPQDEQLWQARANYMARKIGYKVSAVPKNKDDQIHGVLLADRDNPTFISGMYVDPWLRNQGIGKLLIEHFANHHAGIPIKVNVLIRNIRAVKFYESVGFVFDQSTNHITELTGTRRP